MKKTVQEKSILLFTSDKPVLSMKWEEVSEAETPTTGQQVKQVVSGVQEVTCDGPGFPATGGSGEGGGCQSDLLKQPTCLAAAVFGQIKLR